MRNNHQLERMSDVLKIMRQKAEKLEQLSANMKGFHIVETRYVNRTRKDLKIVFAAIK